MTDIRVIGIGSPFGDDALGFEVVKRLSLYDNPRCSFIYADRPGVHLLELMKGASTVFIIDAMKTGAPIGTCHRLVDQEIEAVSSIYSTHAIGVAEAISLGKILNMLPKQMVFYGIEVDEIFLHQKLSQAINHAIDSLVLAIMNEVQTITFLSQSTRLDKTQ